MNKKLERDNKQLELDKKRLTEAKLQAINEKQVAKNAVSALTREIEWLRKQTEVEQQNIVSLVRDRDMMKKSIKNSEDLNSKNQDELKHRQNTIANQTKQIIDAKLLNNDVLKNVQKLDKEKDQYCAEASKANANLMQMVEEVKLKKNLIGELKKENIEYEAKLKQQQNLYEAVRSDRNLFNKNLIEA